MERISSAAYVVSAKALLARAKQERIPYIPGGMSFSGMDCQGLCEYLLMECGIPKAKCNLAGSNAHWRNCVWTGTPEECARVFGSVPPGAWVFIVEEDDSGAPDKYRGDGRGNAGHMGVYLGGAEAVHASASRGCVAGSAFKGKTIRNGGWNRIGLPPWVDYGGDVNLVLAGMSDGDAEDGSTDGGRIYAGAAGMWVGGGAEDGKRIGAGAAGQRGGGNGRDAESGHDADSKPAQGPVGNREAQSPPQSLSQISLQPAAAAPRYVVVETASGTGVRVREKPSKGAITKYTAPDGMRLRVLGESGGYYQVLYNNKPRYVDKRYTVPDAQSDRGSEIPRGGMKAAAGNAFMRSAGYLGRGPQCRTGGDGN